MAAIRNCAGGTISLLRGERGQKERDERTCVRVKSQASAWLHRQINIPYS